jgi:hypothetical protein
VGSVGKVWKLSHQCSIQIILLQGGAPARQLIFWVGSPAGARLAVHALCSLSGDACARVGVWGTGVASRHWPPVTGVRAVAGGGAQRRGGESVRVVDDGCVTSLQIAIKTTKKV